MAVLKCLVSNFSTMSSCLNALAAVVWEDMLRWKLDYLSETKKTIVLKGLGQ